MLEAAAIQIEIIGKEVQSFPVASFQMQLEALSMAQRNSHTILEKGMETLTTMQEDAKLKAMARRLSDKD